MQDCFYFVVLFFQFRKQIFFAGNLLISFPAWPDLRTFAQKQFFPSLWNFKSIPRSSAIIALPEMRWPKCKRRMIHQPLRRNFCHLHFIQIANEFFCISQIEIVLPDDVCEEGSVFHAGLLSKTNLRETFLSSHYFGTLTNFILTACF